MNAKHFTILVVVALFCSTLVVQEAEGHHLHKLAALAILFKALGGGHSHPQYIPVYIPHHHGHHHHHHG